MSYSKTLQAADKYVLGALLAEELGKIVAFQPAHQADTAAAQGAVSALLDIMTEDPEADVRLVLTGTLAGNWFNGAISHVTGAQMSIVLSNVPRALKA